MRSGSVWVSATVAAGTVLLAVVVVVSSAPATEAEDQDVVYDQRQNGSENLRINLSDIRVVVAPAESLLSLTDSAVSTLAYMALLDSKAMGKPAAPSQQRSRLKLSGWLQPLIARAQHGARPHHPH